MLDIPSNAASMPDSHHHTHWGERHMNAHRSITTRPALLLTLVAAIVCAALLPATAQARRQPRGSTWAPHLERSIVPTRVERLGSQLATWYGPGLFGNGTACGGKLTEQSWGIAHRTLPCGTLVNLTYRGKDVTVKVIDRGPFSGASIDLTSRTKYYLGFTSGSVKMTAVKRYRLLPKPNRRLVGTFSSRS
jgi:rare lipoprotein A (peptidoglycan hydrolase)